TAWRVGSEKAPSTSRALVIPNGNPGLTKSQTSGEHFPDNSSRNIRQPEIAAHVLICQPRVIQPKTMQNRCLKVVDVDLVFDDIQPQLVRFADHLAALDAAARQEQAIGERMMIATGIVSIARVANFDNRRAPELAAPDDQRTFQ